MKIIEQNNIKYIYSEELSPYKIAISLKSESNYNYFDMSDNFPENKENRKKFFKILNIKNKKIIHLKQIHSSKILNIDQLYEKQADGMYSNNDMYAMYILTADCYNIFFTTNNNKIFGIVHAGWKGIINGIIENLSSFLVYNSKVMIAQGICSKHFEVKEDVMKLFKNKYSDKYINQINNNKFTIDLRGIIHNILRKKAHIEDIKLCNVCNNDKLFSYRNGDIKYRNLSIIWR